MDARSSLRIVIFPWPAFGHLLPYVELTEQLASRGHRVSYISTPRNLARLPPLHPATAPRVDLVALHLPRIHDGAESTYDLPDDKWELHFEVFDRLAAPFLEFLAAACADDATRPDWIVGCDFHHLAAAAALDHKVPFAVLLPSAALVATVTPPPPSTKEHPTKAAAAVFEKAAAAARAVPRYERERRSLRVYIAQRRHLTQERSTLWAMRSGVEWEPDSFPLVATLLGKPVVPLGLLSPSSRPCRSLGAGHGWMDAQPVGSVLYVAMGSEVRLRVEQVHELALGLEVAGTRFLWALRKPTGCTDADVLPPSFQERTRRRGVVNMGWVPQMSILAHAAVGGFLTHCGQNSLIEGLLFGHPLVMLPMFGDQGPNARQMEANKVGLQVPRDDKDGSFDRHGVAAAIRAVMVDGEARKGFASAAARMKEVVADKELQDRYIDQFIEQLRSSATFPSSN